MPKRGAFALGLTAVALVLLLNFQAPSISPEMMTAGGVGRTGAAGTGGGPVASSGAGSAGSGGGAAASPGTTGTGGTGGAPTTASGTNIVDGIAVSTRFGTVQVEVTLDGTQIVDIAALQLPNGDRRTNQISSYAEPILRSQVLQAQGASIDGISGATYTSAAYSRSLQSALDSVGS